MWGRGRLKPFLPCLEQSLGQILEAAVSVGSRTLEVQLDALLVALHAQVGWEMSTWGGDLVGMDSSKCVTYREHREHDLE